MKIIVDDNTSVVFYPNLPDPIIHIENPNDHAVVLIDVSSINALIEALNKAKDMMEY